MLAGLVGAALSVSGCAYQAAFRNPLADPYLLGAAAGAGLGATVVIVLGGAQVPLALPAAAFAGALGGVGFAYLLGSTRAAGRTSTSLLLAGVAVASFLTAVQTYVQQRNTDDLRAVYAFILGRLGTGGWHEVWIGAAVGRDRMRRAARAPAHARSALARRPRGREPRRRTSPGTGPSS